MISSRRKLSAIFARRTTKAVTWQHQNHDGSIIEIFILEKGEENRNMIIKRQQEKKRSVSAFSEKQQLVRSVFSLFPLPLQILCTCAQCLSDFSLFFSSTSSVFVHKQKVEFHLGVFTAKEKLQDCVKSGRRSGKQANMLKD